MTKKPTIGQQLDDKLDNLATKQDIADLRGDMRSLETRLTNDMGNLRGDMGNLKDDMRNLISAFNANTRSSQAALVAKGIPVKLTTAKASRAGKTTG